MPQSPVRWTSDRRLTRAGARQAHERQTPPVCRRSLTHASQEQSLFLSKFWCGSVLCRVSLCRHLCPSASSSVVSPRNLILPATRMCGRCQRRPRQPISPIPGRPQGGSPPSLRPRTRLRHRPVPSTTPNAAKESSIASTGPSRSGVTVAAIAAPGCVTVPELPIVVIAPALDAPVVLRSAASLKRPENGAGSLQGGFLKSPHRSLDLPEAVLVACLTRATAAADLSSVTSPLWPLRGWDFLRTKTSRLPPPHPAATAHGGSREMPQVSSEMDI